MTKIAASLNMRVIMRTLTSPALRALSTFIVVALIGATLFAQQVEITTNGEGSSEVPVAEITPQEPAIPEAEPVDAEAVQEEAPQSEQTLVASYPVELDYLLYLPENYEEQESWPLMLFLHGAGERGDDLDRVKIHGPPRLIEEGRSFPMIVISPQCPRGRYWEPVALTALLDHIEDNYNVDDSRIYVTGLSMGGFGTWSLAAHSPDRFAAIAPICGGGDRFIVPRLIGNQMGVHVFHGAKDGVVPIERSQEIVDGFKSNGVDVLFTIYPDAGHDSWTETYANDELYTWMLGHSRDPDEER